MAEHNDDRGLASIIDHTLLKPAATAAEIDRLCREARDYRFASVCVNSYWAPRCRERLQGSGVKLCCVVGFPLGAMATSAKAFEAGEAVAAGADEIDMVINLGALKDGELDVVERDIRKVWHPEIRLSIPLLRRRDWPWPQQVCGMNCRTPEEIIRRILEHELIHYKLWMDGVDFGHTERFRELAWAAFSHQSITHGIGSGE